MLEAAESIREGSVCSVGCSRDAALRPLGALRGQPLGLLHHLRRRFGEVHPGLRREDFVRLRCVFPHVEGAPPTPVAKNAQAFYQWALENNYPPIGFYSAYPGLGVLDIRALLADRESQSTAAEIEVDRPPPRERRGSAGTGGRDEPESSRDRLPDQRSRRRQGAAEELPPLMPDLAKAQDDLGTVHFSRFMVEGEEKLLFLSDIDGEVDAAHRAARGECRPGVRRHLRTRGRPSGHARGR